MTIQIPAIAEFIVLAILVVVFVWGVLDIIYSGIAHFIANRRIKKKQHDRHEELDFHEEGFGE
jgi:hypothetical protein